MPTEYELSSDLQELVDQVLNSEAFGEFTPLRQAETIIKSCLKVKLGRDDEPVKPEGELAEVKKVSALHHVFIQADFLLVFDYYTWINFNDAVKKEVIHKALMKIRVKVSDSGVISYGTRKPDICEFRETIVRFGLTDRLSHVREALINAGSSAGLQLAQHLSGSGST